MGYEYNPLGNNRLPNSKDRCESIEPATRNIIGIFSINGSTQHFPGFGFGLDFSGAKNSGVGSEENLEELASFCQMKAVHYFGAEGRKNVEIGLG